MQGGDAGQNREKRLQRVEQPSAITMLEREEKKEKRGGKIDR
jgi:hypothetical protein